MITFIYNEFLYRPLLNLLIWLYNVIPGQDIGIAIIILTLLTRIALYSLTAKSIKSQRELQKIQPEIQKVREKYKKEPDKQGKEMMALYKTHKINPLSGCLPVLIQIPILIALYNVFRFGIDPNHLGALYHFIKRPETINVLFLGLLDLSKSSVLLAFFAGISQFIQSKMLFTKNISDKNKSNFTNIMNQQMIYIMPFMTFIISIKLPAALALYWFVTTLFAIIQQYFIMKNKDNGVKIK